MKFLNKISSCLLISGALAANERIISCEVVGGLGNQLFEIANTLAVAWDYGYEPIFPKISESNSRVSPRPVYWETMFHKLTTYRTSEDLGLEPYYDISGHFYKKIELIGDKIKLIGHFPSGKYFDHHRDRIIQTFQLPTKIKSEVEQVYQEIVNQENENTVSIHIRLDDTFQEPVAGVIDFWRKPYDSYYDEAIALFPGDVTFVVISDNCEWSFEYMKEKLKDRRAVYLCGEDYFDMHLMALCKHNIIVNSTYSWWGAYLNQNPEKIVVSPKYWQMEGNTPYRPDILMPEWTLISNQH